MYSFLLSFIVTADLEDNANKASDTVVNTANKASDSVVNTAEDAGDFFEKAVGGGGNLLQFSTTGLFMTVLAIFNR